MQRSLRIDFLLPAEVSVFLLHKNNTEVNIKGLKVLNRINESTGVQRKRI